MRAGWWVVYVRFLMQCIDGQAWAGCVVGMAYALVHFDGKMYDLHAACACVMVRGPCVGHHDRYEEEPNEPS